MKLYKVLLVGALGLYAVGFTAGDPLGANFVAAGCVAAGFGILFLPPRRAWRDDAPAQAFGPAAADVRHMLKRFDEWCLVAPAPTTEAQEGRWIRLVGAVNMLRLGGGRDGDDGPPETGPVLCEGCGAPAPSAPLPRHRAERDMQTAETLRFALTGRCRSCAAKQGVADARG